ncbi:MAG: T9SS type A sorting domain-containing protein [Bacteroidetes bacterium]|nr:T9SS type A sorting domain-containing protein [Bacteroidota bacterium]
MYFPQLFWDWFQSGLKDPISIHVYAMDGKQVLEFEHEDFTSNVALFNTSSLLPGVYQLSITTKFGEALHQQKLSILK